MEAAAYPASYGHCRQHRRALDAPQRNEINGTEIAAATAAQGKLLLDNSLQPTTTIIIIMTTQQGRRGWLRLHQIFFRFVYGTNQQNYDTNTTRSVIYLMQDDASFLRIRKMMTMMSMMRSFSDSRSLILRHQW
jgi:hypothetical protein